MPFKDKDQYRRYMSGYMKRQRSFERQVKSQMRSDVANMERLQKAFPTAYQLLFGKRRRK